MTNRLLCQFSCGAASAVATKIAVQTWKPELVVVLNADVVAEHEDRRRFLADCEKWIGREFTILRDEKYGADPIEVFKRRRYIKGRYGAACSGPLKRDLLRSVERPGDVLVLGYTAEEEWRYDDFVEAWPDRKIVAPLIARGLTKEDCKAMVLRAGIRLPRMYELGYDNANCIACVKGGAKYFRAIRQDFPEQFERLAQVEEEIGPSAYILYHRSGPLKGQRFPLRELSTDGPVQRQRAHAVVRAYLRSRGTGIHRSHPMTNPTSAPEQEPSDDDWSLIKVKTASFIALMTALERADRKGYMPDAMASEWFHFEYDYAPATAPTEQPARAALAELVAVIDSAENIHIEKFPSFIPFLKALEAARSVLSGSPAPAEEDEDYRKPPFVKRVRKPATLSPAPEVAPVPVEAMRRALINRAVEWIRNNYQDHNIGSLCDGLRAAISQGSDA